MTEEPGPWDPGDTCFLATTKDVFINNTKAVTVVGAQNVNINCGADRTSGDIPNNVKAQMESDLQKNSDIFQTTTGFTACMDVLRMNSSVLIVADPGDGKTTLACGIARHLSTTAWGDGILYTPVFITSPEEWRRYVDPKQQQVVVIDDIFGTHNLLVEVFQRWMSILPNVEGCLKQNGGTLLVIITSRRSILNEVLCPLYKFKLFYEEKTVCLSNECNLTRDDKLNIMMAHIQRARLKISDGLTRKIIDGGRHEGFPRTCDVACRVGADVNQLFKLFKCPTEIISQELQVISQNKHQKALLWLCLFEGGQLKIDTALEITNAHKSIIEKAGAPSCVTYVLITESGKGIPLCYVQTELHENYTISKFSHPSVLFAVANQLAKDHLAYLLKNCSFQLIVDLFRLDSDVVRDSATTIGLTKTEQSILVNRIIVELTDGNLQGICSHVAFAIPEFVDLFFMIIKERCLSKLLLKRDRNGLSLLYWSVWSIGKLLCKCLLDEVYCNYKHKSMYLEDVCTAVIGSSVSGNAGALEVLLNTFPTAKLKKCINKMKHLKHLASRSDGVFSSLLHLAYLSRSTNCMIIHLKTCQQEKSIGEIKNLLTESANSENCIMFEAILYNISKHLLNNQSMEITLPLCFRKILSKVLVYLVKAGTEIILNFDKTCYHLILVSWRPKWKYYEMKLELNQNDVTYKFHVKPRLTMYDKMHLGYDAHSVLHRSAMGNLLELVEVQLSLGTDPNIESANETILFTCCRLNKIVMVRCLLEYGALVSLPCAKSKRTPLYAACRQGHVDIALLLLIKGADWNMQNESRYEILRLACLKGYITVVELLVKGGTDVNITWEIDLLTPLGLACMQQNKHLVKKLIDLGANVNLQMGNDDETPLLQTCRMWNGRSIAKVLLEHSAKPDKRSGIKNILPLEQACKTGNEETVKLLLDYGAKIFEGNATKEGFINIACRTYLRDVVNVLIKKLPSFDHATGPDSMTPLHVACSIEHNYMVDLFLSSNADVNQICKDGQTLLQKACKQWRHDIINLLIENGADVNRSFNDHTPLEIAVVNRRNDVVDLLCQFGAKVNRVCNGQKAVLHLACASGQNDIVETLLKYGALVDVRTLDTNETPLLLAVRHSHYDVVQTLIESSANINKMAGLKTESPLFMSCDKFHMNIIPLLLEKGANVNSTCGPMNDSPLLHMCRKFKLKNVFNQTYKNDIISIITLLIDSCADVNLRGGDGGDGGDDTPLSIAMTCSDGKLTDLLKRYGAKEYQASL